MKTSFQDVMRHATRLTRTGRLADATSAIQRALSGRLFRDRAEPAPRAAESDAPAICLPGPVEVVPTEAITAIHIDHGTTQAQPAREDDHPQPIAPAAGGAGRFITGTCTHAGLTRTYKLFVPAAASSHRLPLVVMLHGCTQDPDDFAAGTDMNRLAEELGFAVLYPAQAQQANPSKCWNWFKHNHQGRDNGEPAVIAAMTRSIIDEWSIDAQRVYIAGLSAGGAMAAVVAAAYPEIFAAVGVHSGLAPGAARSLPEALSAMQGASFAMGVRTANGRETQDLTVPAIVFHGDADRTVHPRNGDEVVASALRGVDNSLVTMESTAAAGTTRGTSSQGQSFTRHVHADGAGRPVVEHWILHGAGHAWAGGSADGSFTDPAGPDASREMLRFFLENPRASLQ